MRCASLVCLLALCGSAWGQWLPDKVQEREKELWSRTGVEFPKGLKFYEVPRVSQRLVILNNRDVMGIYAAKGVNKTFPWVTTAGLHFSPASQWRRVTGAVFPGKIKVKIGTTQVFNGKNYQDARRIEWSFPSGTIFAEMLVRVDGDREWPFEIRVRQKEGKVWDAGTAYRPMGKAEAELFGERLYNNRVSGGELLKITGQKVVTFDSYRVAPEFLEGRVFTPSHVALRSTGDFFPAKYTGNMIACNKCHSQAGDSRGYGSVALSGSDFALGWHPFKLTTLNTDADPVLDMRWPLEKR